MSAIPTTQGPMTADDICDHLSYRAYAYNRDKSPHISPEEWARYWPGAEALEVRYQAEQALKVTA